MKGQVGRALVNRIRGGGGGACDSTASDVGSGPEDLDFALRFRGGT